MDDKERVFNLFYFCSSRNQIIHELGVVCHEISGTDEGKLTFLQSRAKTDFANAKRYLVPDRYLLIRPGAGAPLPALFYQAMRELARVGKLSEVFQEILEERGASGTPLICGTAIVDGEPRIDSPELLGEAQRALSQPEPAGHQGSVTHPLKKPWWRFW